MTLQELVLIEKEAKEDEGPEDLQWLWQMRVHAEGAVDPEISLYIYFQASFYWTYPCQHSPFRIVLS